MEDKDWFLFSYDNGKIIVRQAETSLIRRSASSAEVHGVGCPEMRPWCRVLFVRCRMSLAHARLRRRRYLADGTNLKTIIMFEKQDALTRTTSSTKRAEMAEFEVSAGHLPSNPAMPYDEEVWTIGDQVDVDAEVRVGMKRRFCELQ